MEFHVGDKVSYDVSASGYWKQFGQRTRIGTVEAIHHDGITVRFGDGHMPLDLQFFEFTESRYARLSHAH